MANPASKPASTQPWLTWIALAVALLAVWIVFGGARDFHFVLWDDDHNIQQNPHLSGVTWDNLRWMFSDTAYSRRYFPLAWLGWNVEHDLFGLTPRSAHVGNVLFHLLNTVLVFLVIKSVLRLWLPREQTAGLWPANVAATLGALLWALHPLRAEVVAWASGRIYAQAASFLLVSAWCYLRSLELESSPVSASATRHRWVSVAALALSLLTYPLALTYVGVLLLFDWYRPGRPASATPAPVQLRCLIVGKIPFLVVTLVVLGLTLWSRTNGQEAGWKAPVSLGEFGVASRFMQACYIWAYYLWKPLLPLHLSPYYTRLISFAPGDLPFVLSLLSVVLLTVVLFWRRRAWPGVWLVWLCHLCVLIPVLGLTEHPHFASDRYSYMASVPWSVAVAVVIVQLWPRTAAVLAPAAAVVALGVLCGQQVGIWRDTESLGLHMVAQMGDHPRRFDIYRRMSVALRDEGKVAESNAYFIQSLKGDPHAAEKALAQARRLEDQGQSPAAFAQYQIASQLRPDLAEPRYRLGSILLAEDRAADALPFLREAVRLDPGSADAQITLGWALNRTNQSPEAIPHFETALRQRSNDAAAHSGLGVALITIGHPREALPQFEEVLRLVPNSAVAHYNLGLALLDGVGRPAEAAAQFEAALRLQPDYPDAREALERSRR